MTHNIRQFATATLLGVGFLLSVGCRATPVGWIADGVARSAAVKYQNELIGRPVADADTLLGPRMDTLQETRTQEQYIRYPIGESKRKTNFYLVRVSRTGGVRDVTRWMEGADPLDDAFALKKLKERVMGKSPGDAETAGNLVPPMLVLVNSAQPGYLRCYDVSNATYYRPRILVLAFDEASACCDVAFYGVTGAGRLHEDVVP